MAVQTMETRQLCLLDLCLCIEAFVANDEYFMTRVRAKVGVLFCE